MSKSFHGNVHMSHWRNLPRSTLTFSRFGAAALPSGMNDRITTAGSGSLKNVIAKRKKPMIGQCMYNYKYIYECECVYS